MGGAGSPSGAWPARFGRLATHREIEQAHVLRIMGATFLIIRGGRYRYGKGIVRMNPLGPNRNRRCRSGIHDFHHR